MAACAQQAFTAAVIEKEGVAAGGGGKRVSIKIYKFIAEMVIYFSVFPCLGGSVSLTCQGGNEDPTRGKYERRLVFSRPALPPPAAKGAK